MRISKDRESISACIGQAKELARSVTTVLFYEVPVAAVIKSTGVKASFSPIPDVQLMLMQTHAINIFYCYRCFYDSYEC